VETVLETEQAAKDKVARELLALQKESEVVQKQLTDLRGAVSQTTATTAVSAKAAEEQIRTLQKQLEEAARDVDTAQQAIASQQQRVETAQRELDVAKKELADSKTMATQLETRSNQAQKEIEALQAAQKGLPTTKQLDDLRRALEESDRDLKKAATQAEREAASAKTASIELERLRASTASLPTAAQLAQLEQALAAARQELDKAREDSLASNERITALKTELMDIKSRPPPPLPTSSGKWRHSTPAPFQDTSDPGSDSLRGAGTESLRQQVLTSATTGVESTSASARLRTRETEEIERLEKVIEAQQAMIDDQREKIVFWQRVSAAVRFARSAWMHFAMIRSGLIRWFRRNSRDRGRLSVFSLLNQMLRRATRTRTPTPTPPLPDHATPNPNHSLSPPSPTEAWTRPHQVSHTRRAVEPGLTSPRRSPPITSLCLVRPSRSMVPRRARLGSRRV
jgi:hypothetical protein